MTRKSYHVPPAPDSPRAKCPVCRQAVYSPAGIHPQCAVQASEPPRPKKVPDTVEGSPILPGTESAVPG